MFLTNNDRKQDDLFDIEFENWSFFMSTNLFIIYVDNISNTIYFSSFI